MTPQASSLTVVTGGCGFIGSEVVRQLLDRGYRVRVVDDLSKPESAVRSGEYEFLHADLTDPTVARRALDGASFCVHLAAKIGGIGYFHKYPATILSENNKLYSAVFEAAVRADLQRFVYVSSSMAFESAERFPCREEDLLSTPIPKSAYGFSKLIGEWYCRAFAEERGLRYTICRPFNAYGVNEYPGDEIGYAHVIPDLVKKVLSGQDPLELLGDGEQTRCFTHVSDIARGIVTAMEHPAAVNEDFNVGTSEETRIRDLAEQIWRLCGRVEPFRVRSVTSFVYDVRRRVPDVRKAKVVLDWGPAVRLEDGLREVVAWLQRELPTPVVTTRATVR